jgi:hypothetical protein
MNIIFLDFDGVMNSQQSVEHWRWRYEKGDKSRAHPESLDEEFDRKGMWIDPMALANLSYILEEHPNTYIVVSSTWRKGRDPEWFNKFFEHYELLRDKICFACDGEKGYQKSSADDTWLPCTRCEGKGFEIHPMRDKGPLVISKTPVFHGKDRGDEIADWLEKHKEIQVDRFVILDDDSDMSVFLDTPHFIQTDSDTGLDWKIVRKVCQVFGDYNLKLEDLKPGIPYKRYNGGISLKYFIDEEGKVFSFNSQQEKSYSRIYKDEVFALA